MSTPLNQIDFRNYEGLHPTEYVVEYACEQARPGWVRNWVIRIVHEDNYSKGPVIEFYSADTNQFVSSYYLDTFLGRDQWGNGYGYGLDLWGDVPAWKISAYDADQIRGWCENVCF